VHFWTIHCIEHSRIRNKQCEWTEQCVDFIHLSSCVVKSKIFKNGGVIIRASFCCSKEWESCIYFQRKLHLCTGSCIYAHIWLRKTWHNLYSFARTSPKAKIFRTSTSNWIRALSYLAGVGKLLACKPTVSS